jgi:EAL domain-containing protein (putative c-di-GMP-specific phosphodiesterase class I)
VFHIENEEHYISASIGIALYPYDGVTSEELMRHADTAMYRAKQDGRGRYRFFEEEMNISINKRLQLERDLRQALKQRQFRLHFQPMLDLNNNMINGAEALLHWQHPEQGIIAAHQFVPMAEEAGLMEDIGQWSVQQTLDYYLSWQKRGLTLQHIAINLSNRQFQSPESLAMIESLLKSTRIPPRRLELELNEDLFMQDDHTVESHFRRLHQLGVQLSINNFGTGRASLHYLKQLPVDILKIDKSFLRQVPDDRHSVALLESIIAMAKKLQKQIIIVGIENTAQLEFIRRNHCNRIQGHHLSPALSADEFLVFVQRYNHCNSDKSAVAKLA